MPDTPPLSRPRKAQAAAAKKAGPAKKAEPAKKAAPKQTPKIGGGNGQGGRPSKADMIAKIQGTIEAGAGALITAGGVKGSDALIYDGKVIAYQAPKMAAEVYALSLSNEYVRKALEAFYSTGRQLDSLTVILGTMVPILVAHGRLPAQALAIPGVGSKALTDAVGPPPQRLAPVHQLRPDPLERTETTAAETPTVEVPWAGARKRRDQAPAPAPDPSPEEVGRAVARGMMEAAAEEAGETLPATAADDETSTLGVSLAALAPPGI